MASQNEASSAGRKRVGQIFRYLEALNQLRNPVKRLVREQPWVLWLAGLPGHPAVRVGTPGEEPGSGDDFILKVSRPKLTRAPEPPAQIAGWLRAGWDGVEAAAEVHDSLPEVIGEGQALASRFEDDPERPRRFAQWRELRDEWVRRETPARQAFKVFERFYELYGHIQREAERVELVLGDGILSWRHPEGDVEHPVLLQRLHLQFNPDVPEFTLREADYPVELYSALFRALPDVEGPVIGRCREELEEGAFHPLGGEATSDFLRSFAARLHARGEFAARGEIGFPRDYPRLFRRPVVFMRNRTLGFASALETIVREVQGGADPPSSLLNIAGVEPLPRADPGGGPEESGGGNEDEQILMSKPANPEQLQIAQRLERHGCVLVQGPPGTGKTHTIANLIGHLLAEGKTVLVTSHTAKALRVLREQVVEPLRPLCVSVLESDAESRGQLESSVQAIVERLSSADADHLQSESAGLARQRGEILASLRAARDRLTRARGDEYQDVVVAGQGYAPSNAARLVAEGSGANAWIPGPAEPGAPPPLGVGELIELYRTNTLVTPEDERELSAYLPALGPLMPPTEFEQLVQERTRLGGANRAFRAELWRDRPEGEDAEGLEALLGRLMRAVEGLREEKDWKVAILAAGRQGVAAREAWDHLCSLIVSVHEEAMRLQRSFVAHGPALAPDQSPAEQSRLLDEITAYVEGGGRLGRLTLLRRPAWKRLLDAVRVGGEPPSLPEHFRALRDRARLEVARRDLAGRWERLIAASGGPSVADLGQPEATCVQFCPLIKNHLDWHGETWIPLEAELGRRGFAWTALLDEMPPIFGPHGDLLRVRDAVLHHLPAIFAARIQRVRWGRAEQSRSELMRLLDAAAGDDASAEIVGRIRAAVSRQDPDAYRAAFERLADLHSRRAVLERRRELLRRLEASAPAWAAAIRERRSPHDGPDQPGDAPAAWLWRQLYDELERRASTSLEALQSEIAALGDSLRTVTSDLIDRRAWAAQARRTNLRQRQALMGWLALIRRIGKATGKRAPKLQAEARKLMAECRSAVPVWVMPLTRVVESFRPRAAQFDVVIVDEASQSDVMGLIALYMGKSVVIVGDHEQVSPDAVGQRIDEAQHLIDEHLTDIPNKVLYDGQASIYDLAGWSFGGNICLTEHFRCVPDIVRFSNHLSYSGRIKPLRDASSVSLKPHILAYRVEGAASDERTNPVEAEALASLLVAATEQPEYAGCTFGVISLVGEEQARLIDTLLRNRLEPAEYERRRIVCGNAAQFQGDERDVMFLSVVDGPRDNPLPLREFGPRDMFKKRFNVAASRARDQMWVVHSLDPQIHLQARDIRRRLIEHAQDPQALFRLLERTEPQAAESQFERAVMRRLVSAGYRVTPQWKVGYHQIDLVVEGGGKRLAVECDGDRHRSPEKLREDMARQALLERLGWSFVRVRGSQFFRDPERALRPVFTRLEALEIPPDAAPAGRPVAEQGTELRDRVLRRAQEIRRSESTGAVLQSVLPEPDASPSRTELLQTLTAFLESKTTPTKRQPVTAPTNDQEADGKTAAFLSSAKKLPDQRAEMAENPTQEEITAALHRHVPGSGAIERRLLLDRAAFSLGFARVEPGIGSRLNRALSVEVQAKRLEADASRVWKARQQAPNKPHTAGRAFPAVAPSDGTFKIGQKVRHGTFGEGIVIGCVDERDETYVTVEFFKVGVKKLAAGVARLETLR